MSQAQKLITVAQYADPIEAQLARIALEEAGIRCVVLGEPVVSGLYPTGVFPVSLQVLETDAERAASVLNEKMLLDEWGEEGEVSKGDDL
ncbi:MAG TPA: DUF2007 domain-containing protein [Anaerohalosphaeraceae bacterium]|nr:DUF2007 domain-containing protein [Anaerohalosphaeraceae bacterium]HOL89083.1 DUF2007 domain-containing protein [Anaerohalosphaeraceae bacterium]HPP56623.1 DUF2007 domain-containing protein [Anaerohalosphaeraceae bacterium]